VSSVENTTTKTTAKTMMKQFAVTDGTIPFRFVGSYEYANALDSMNRLVNMSTSEELFVYDQVLNDRPEFAYFNGANTAFKLQPDLKTANPFDRSRFYDSFQKKGLAWMMALARIELGATMSMYGNDKTPFESVANSRFDLGPYLEVLTDDVVAHMKSLAQEPGFEEVVRRNRKIDTWTLAYLRRIKMIRDMLSALSTAGNDAVDAQIKPYDIELKRYERRLIEQIQHQTQPRSGTSTRSFTSNGIKTKKLKVSKSFISDCQDIVEQSDPGYNPSESDSGSGRNNLKITAARY
jgi:hypothetical protein